MTNDELAKAIESGLDGSDYVSFVLCDAEWQQIIAALRRSERPPSGEMVMVPRPRGMLEPLRKIGARLLVQFDGRFGIAQPIQFTDNERQTLVAALKILRDALDTPLQVDERNALPSAAEAEGRKS